MLIALCGHYVSCFWPLLKFLNFFPDQLLQGPHEDHLRSPVGRRHVHRRRAEAPHLQPRAHREVRLQRRAHVQTLLRARKGLALVLTL